MSAPQKLMWDDERFAKVTDSVEMITREYAERMLLQAGMAKYPEDATLTVFDNACGQGVVTSALHKIMQPRPQASYDVTCGDLANAMVEAARQRVKTENWTNTKVLKVDAQDTKLSSNHFTHIFTNFGPMLFPNPDAMLSECKRMLRPGGICAFTTWKEIGWLEDIKGAMQSIPDLPVFPAPHVLARAFCDEPWEDAEFIREKMTSHGFTDIKIETVPNTSRCGNAAELKAVLTPVIAIIASKFWTQDQREKFEGSELNEKIQKWVQEKYEGGPVEWHWIGLVTTSAKP